MQDVNLKILGNHPNTYLVMTAPHYDVCGYTPMMAKQRKPKTESETPEQSGMVVFTVRIEPEVAAALDAMRESQLFPPTRSVVVVSLPASRPACPRLPAVMAFH